MRKPRLSRVSSLEQRNDSRSRVTSDISAATVRIILTTSTVLNVYPTAPSFGFRRMKSTEKVGRNVSIVSVTPAFRGGG